MRYLVDPAAVRLELVGVTFAVIVCVVLPALAIKQHRGLETGTLPAPTRAQIYGSALLMHFFLVLTSAVVAWRARLDLFPSVSIGVFGVAVGVVALAMSLLLLTERFQKNLDALTLERSRMMAPRTSGDYAAFYLISATAGFSEQLAYRGALFAILSAITDSWWASAGIAAVAFAVVHVFQGWRSVGYVALIALRDQIIVGLTGTLVIAMVVHAIHDMIAATVLGYRVRRDEQGGRTLAVS